jgi:hypothetical protein
MELDEEYAIGVAKLNAAVHLASKDDELMPECGILVFEPALRLEGRSQQLQSQEDQRDHSRKPDAILSMV